MKSTFRFIQGALTALTLMSAVAPSVFAGESSPAGKNEFVPLPISGLALADRNGKMRLVSDNGRFIIEGKIYDTWNKEFVETLDQARDTMTHLNLQKLNLDVDDLAPFTYGAGPKEVTVFVDPYCGWCKRLLSQMKGLESQYTFKILPIPVLGERSSATVRSLQCTTDRQKAAQAVFTESGYDTLPVDANKACDTDALGKRLITAQMFGVKGVPFMIRHDGLIQQGFVKEGLANWLKAEGK